ncbi:MAG: helix-turn-helix transcriptional regulator [Proteobacteria bacterium]|nr:helix-turn-helix transcriptional regulator [Pseudomonadota bacterium]
MSHLQNYIRKKLEEKNMSINALERVAGLKTNAVHNILKGASKNPKKETLLAIATTFECSVKDLTEGIDETEGLTSSSSQDKTSQEANPTWDPDLYAKIIEILTPILAKRTTLPLTKKIHSLIWEIYLYSFFHEEKKVDPRFVEWLINKYS